MFSCPHTFGLYCTFLIVCWRFWLLNTVSCFCIWHWLKYKSSDLQLFTFQFLSSDEKWTLNMQEGSSGIWVQLWGTFTFQLMLLCISTPRHFRGKYCTFSGIFHLSVCFQVCVCVKSIKPFDDVTSRGGKYLKKKNYRVLQTSHLSNQRWLQWHHTHIWKGQV